MMVRCPQVCVTFFFCVDYCFTLYILHICMSSLASREVVSIPNERSISIFYNRSRVPGAGGGSAVCLRRVCATAHGGRSYLQDSEKCFQARAVVQ